jgi:transcriptional regulator with XRE-family HTH domain
VAFLLGCKSGTKISRYERFNRNPNLETALAYEIVFGTPMRELFAGAFQKVEEKIKKRAQLLFQKLNESNQDRLATRKLEMLKGMIGGQIELSKTS